MTHRIGGPCFLVYGVAVAAVLSGAIGAATALAQAPASREQVRELVSVVSVEQPVSFDIRFLLTMKPTLCSRDDIDQMVRRLYGDTGKPGGPFEQQFQEALEQNVRTLTTPAQTAGRLRFNRADRSSLGDSVLEASTSYGDSPNPPSDQPEFRIVSIDKRGFRSAVYRNDRLAERISMRVGRSDAFQVAEWTPVPVGVHAIFAEFFRVRGSPISSSGEITEEMIDLVVKGDGMRVTVERGVPSRFKSEPIDRWSISMPAVSDRPMCILETRVGDVSKFERVEMRTREGDPFLIREVQSWREDGWPASFELTSGKDRIAAKEPMQISIISVKTDSKPIDFDQYRKMPEGFTDGMAGVQPGPEIDLKKR